MTKVRLAVLLVACALWPASARAQSDFIDWLAEFSGPGPFQGFTVSTRTICARDNAGTLETRWCINDTDPNIKTVMNVEFGWGTTGSQARFTDTPADIGVIHASRVNVTYMYRVGPMLDVGVGVGALFFSGDGFSTQAHPIFTPATVTFTPLGVLRGPTSSKWGRVLRIKFSDRYVFGDLKAADFRSPSAYLRRGEFNPGFGIGLDFWSFLSK